MSFKRLDPEDFILSAESITAPAWSTNTQVLGGANMFLSNAQINSDQGVYYYSVYHVDPQTNADAAVQFDIAFGAKDGGGSGPYSPSVPGYSPSATIYGQFHNLIIGDEEQEITYQGIAQDYFYAITIDRNRYKEKLLPGTFNLKLDGISLTDNSKDLTSLQFNEAGRVFQIVSGSDGAAVSAAATAPNAVANGMTSAGSYGLFLPDIGTILLNGAALDLSTAQGGIGLNTGFATSDQANPNKLFNSLVAGSQFALNSEETITSDFVFIRARNGEFNYSENPSFISSSQGVVIYDNFINNPQSFITTVGLYNDNNDLLATAKLSKPLKKDFTKEALVRVKLDF